MNNANDRQIGLKIDDNTYTNLTSLRASLSPGKILSASAVIRQLINSAVPQKISKKASKKH